LPRRGHAPGGVVLFDHGGGDPVGQGQNGQGGGRGDGGGPENRGHGPELAGAEETDGPADGDRAEAEDADAHAQPEGAIDPAIGWDVFGHDEDLPDERTGIA
jgi:hypothetical protein